MLLMLLLAVGPGPALAQADCGDGPACLDAGLAYTRSAGLGPDLRASAAALDAACRQGDPDGACGHARLLHLAWPELGAPPQAGASSLAAAAQALEQACGDGPACVTLGLAYEQGLGVGADPSRALGLHKQACAAGVARGCARAAALHSGGPPAWRDPARAAELNRQACNAGDGMACEALGVAALGSGAAGAADRAAPMLSKACEAGTPTACARLGRLHLDGALSASSPDTGRALLQRACAAGDTSACEGAPR